MQISLEEARKRLIHGEVVGIPTETVYGLAASLDHPAAIDQIFTLKGRPSSNPLIVHLARIEQIASYAAVIPDDFANLAEAFWPGPMTVVLPIQEDQVPERVRAGLSTAAFRIPDHSLTLALLEWVGPLVMPSANRSGKPSSTSRQHIESDFGLHFPVLDGGRCHRGVESTILYYDFDRWHIVRLGALSPDAFQPILGYSPQIVIDVTDKPLCPGQLHRHYAPQARLLIDASPHTYQGVVLGFKERTYQQANKVLLLGSLMNASEVAENLYHILRQLDIDQVQEACVDMSFPDQGLWITVAERLTRAAAY